MSFYFLSDFNQICVKVIVFKRYFQKVDTLTGKLKKKPNEKPKITEKTHKNEKLKIVIFAQKHRIFE